VKQEDPCSFDAVWADLTAIYQVRAEQRPIFTRRLTESDIQKWRTTLRVSRATLYDMIAMRLARGFYASDLDFTFCDTVINDINRVITLSKEGWPDLCRRVYLAFDEGEYYHNNNRDEKPSEVYTRPQIARIIEGSRSDQIL